LRSIAFKDKVLSKKVSFIRQDFNDKRKTCNAYLVFANKEDAQKALKAHNRIVDDFHIRVDLATGERKLDNARSIFIGNLPFEAEEEDVRKHFEQSGDVETVRLIRDQETNYGKGFGYVMFKDRTSLPDALRLNEAPFNGRKLRVSRAQKHSALTPGTLRKEKTNTSTSERPTPKPKSFQGVYAQKDIVPHIPTKSKRSKGKGGKGGKGGKNKGRKGGKKKQKTS